MNNHLQNMRLQADPLADELIKRLFEEGHARVFGELMAHVPQNGDALSERLPGYLLEYFEKTACLPDWADRELLRSGSVFFSRYVKEIMMLLGMASLPFCYAAADGVKVLYLSKRIQYDTTKRLAETAQFVVQVLLPHAFEKHGQGIRSIQKVRLMHAAVRYHIGKSGKWDMAWGVPVNQEDLLGTMLSFSFLILRSMRKTGLSISHRDAWAYLHSWNVVASMMGLDQSLVPQDEKHASQLYQLVIQRTFKPSDEGIELTRALVESMESLPPYKYVKGFTPTFIRYLMGDEYADMLKIPPPNWTKPLIGTMRMVNAVRSIAHAKAGSAQATASEAEKFIAVLNKEYGLPDFNPPVDLYRKKE